jgi:ferredoxin-thioredoxin reductase catalytic subunit
MHNLRTNTSHYCGYFIKERERERESIADVRNRHFSNFRTIIWGAYIRQEGRPRISKVHYVVRGVRATNSKMNAITCNCDL